MGKITLKELISRERSRFILFGGKGGVGKTTCAAATAIYAASTGKKVLIISTDPAHSLGDSLGLTLNPGEETKVDAVPNLWALEIKNEIEESEVNTVLSNQMGNNPLLAGLGDVSGMQPPGSDEALAFGKVLEFIARAEYDLIIFDTAPTGHTLRLLQLPDTLSSFFGKMLRLKLQLSKFLSGFKNMFGGGEENEAAEMLDNLDRVKESIEIARDALQDPEQTSFVTVMIPEQMAIAETDRLLNSLFKNHIHCSNIIVNQMITENTDCEFCKERRKMQQTYLQQIRDLYEYAHNLIPIAQYKGEIRGFDRLKIISNELFK